MIGVSPRSARDRMRRQTSKPSTSGRLMSRMMMSGRVDLDRAQRRLPGGRHLDPRLSLALEGVPDQKRDVEVVLYDEDVRRVVERRHRHRDTGAHPNVDARRVPGSDGAVNGGLNRRPVRRGRWADPGPERGACARGRRPAVSRSRRRRARRRRSPRRCACRCAGWRRPGAPSSRCAARGGCRAATSG